MRVLVEEAMGSPATSLREHQVARLKRGVAVLIDEIDGLLDRVPPPPPPPLHIVERG